MRRVTIHDVAREAGVASITASRALSGSGATSVAVRQRVWDAARQLGYVPNDLAQGLKFGSTRTIGLVVSDITNPFFTAIVRGAEDVAHEAGYSVIVCNTDEQPDKQDVYLGVLRRKRVDGVLLVPAGADVTGAVEWRQRHGPLVVLDRSLPGVTDHSGRALGIDTVRGESRAASERLVAHLIAHGHRRIALINGPRHLSTAADRRAGFCLALRHAGIEPALELQRHGPFTVDHGYAATLAILDLPQPPTALFLANNFLTIGALAAVRERGLSVPKDIAVAGFEASPRLALLAPYLTRVALPAIDIGRRATEWLLERIAHGHPADGSMIPGRELILQSEIVIRSSCGCPEVPPGNPPQKEIP